MTDRLPARGEVFVVDDDPAIRKMLSIILSDAGFEVICFADGAALLAVAKSRSPACILLDVFIPGSSGLNILTALQAENYPAPIYMISGQGDIAMAVKAIRAGALDFIEKPFRGSDIIARINEGIAAYEHRVRDDVGSEQRLPLHFPGRQPLTRREREVLMHFMSGESNKGAGRKLGISSRTIEDHRANIMKKLGARNSTDLIRMVMTATRSA